MTDLIQHLVDALSLGALYALFSLSIAVIFGVARIVNFANGELITIAGYTMILVVGLAWPLVVICTLIVVVLAALLMDRAVFRFARQAPPTTLLIVSFAVSYFLQNAIQLAASSRPKTLDFGSALIKSVDVLGVRVGLIDIVTIGVTAVLIVALTLVLSRTTVGRQLRAASEDFAMTRLLGVPANRVIAYAFAISGALAGVAGILLTINTATVTPTFGVTPVIIAFVATVIGGIGSLAGAAVGGLAMGAITVLLQTALPESLKPYRDAFVFALVIALLLVRPRGILPPKFTIERV
jgi:branched-chain amino acid transport system permease protein